MRIAPLSTIVLMVLSVGCGSGGSSGSSSSNSSSATTATNTVVNPTTTPSTAALSLKLTADGRWLKDDLGRVVFLNGVNSSVSAKRAPYHSWQTESDYQALPDNGMNFVRLVLQWKAIEPSPGVYDTQFLNELERRLDWCHNQGLIVLLDMHQDAFSEKVGGNGAPDWATFDDNWPQFQIPNTLPWQAVYAQPKVIAAFENFWNNRTVPQTGLGVQDHYALMWKHLATRFQNHPAVMGYDLMNEPYYGGAILTLVWETLLYSPQLLIPAALQMGLNGVSFQAAAIGQLSQSNRLYGYLNHLQASVGGFETNKLQPFYSRVASAIRDVDSKSLIFIEPSILVGIGIRSSLTAVKDAQGQSVSGIVYAPHYYDPIAEALPYDGKIERAREAFRRLADTGQRLNVPVVIGEWGFLRSSLAGHKQLAKDQQLLINEFMMGQGYWDFHSTLTSQPFWSELVRPRVERVAGVPQSIQYDPATNVLELRMSSAGLNQETIISTPLSLFPNGVQVQCSDPSGTWSFQSIDGGRRVAISINEQVPQHTLTITAK